MADKREYRLKISAYTRETMPMKRLAEYLSDMAILLGDEKGVHLIAVESGSTCPVILVDWEAEPKIRDRIVKVRNKEGPVDAMDAADRLDKRLVADNGYGDLIAPDQNKILEFPGVKKAKPIEWPSINQAATFYGVPIAIGGKNDPVPVQLEDGAQEIFLLAERAKAKEIANYLFTTVLKVDGRGRWRRLPEGTWSLERFIIDDFTPLEGGNVQEVLARLRGVDAAWKKLADPLGHLEEIRHDKH